MMLGVLDGVGVNVAVPAGVGVSVGVGVMEWVGLGVVVALAVRVGDGVFVWVLVKVGDGVEVGVTWPVADTHPAVKPTANKIKEARTHIHQRRMPQIYSFAAGPARGTKGLMIHNPRLDCSNPPSTK